MSDRDQSIAANVLDRQFVADRPNQRWVGDTTEFTIGSRAKLYLAAATNGRGRFVRFCTGGVSHYEAYS